MRSRLVDRRDGDAILYEQCPGEDERSATDVYIRPPADIGGKQAEHARLLPILMRAMSD